MSHNGHSMVLCDVRRDMSSGVSFSQMYVLQSNAVPGRQIVHSSGITWTVVAIADPRPKSPFAIEQETRRTLGTYA